MKFTAFFSRVLTEEVTIEAETKSEAKAQLRKLIEERTGASSAVLRSLLIDPQGLTDFGYGFRLQHKERMAAASTPPDPTANSVHAYFLDELVKTISVTEALAHCSTTEDLVIDRESDVDEVLASRDNQEEYDAFMSYIRFARRAMNLPDVFSELGEEDEG